MLKLKVIIENRQKDIKIPTGLKLLARKGCHAVLQLEKFDEPAEISVSFVTDDEIRQLNREYRKKDMVTDVLSFPMGENGVYDKNPETGANLLGDVVISLKTAYAQAQRYEHSFQREVVYLTVHSVLHLLGYDHENGGIARSEMREKEEQVMAMLGISRTAIFSH